MSILEFGSSLASSLAWPVIALVALAVFGREFKRWLAVRPDRVRIGPVEAEWQRQAARVGASIDTPITDDTRSVSSIDETLTHVADAAPIVAIDEAVAALEAALIERMTNSGMVEVSGLGPASLARRAESHGVIKPEARQSLVGLSIMQGLAHSREGASPERARDFIQLANAMMYVVTGK